MITRGSTRSATHVTNKAKDTERTEDTFPWERLPPEIRQQILMHAINRILNRYLEPGARLHREHKTTERLEAEEALIAVKKTFRYVTPGDYQSCLKLALSRLQPELDDAIEDVERLGGPGRTDFPGHPERYQHRQALRLQRKLEHAIEHFEQRTIR